MRVRLRLLCLALVTGMAVSVAGASVSAGRPAAARLTAFDGCPSFLAYARKQALPFVGPWGLGGVVGIAAGAPEAARGAVAGPGDTDHSTTNVQEEGVDEPDLVKTDGSTLFVATDGRVSALDVRGSGRPRLVDTLRLDRGADELLLSGGHLLVLSRGAVSPIPVDGVGIRAPYPSVAKTVVADVDVRDPARMRLVRTLELDGSYLAARLAGGAVRLVLSSQLGVDLPFVQPGTAGAADADAARQRNRGVARAAGARAWLPGLTLRGATGKVVAERRLVQCRQISRPRAFGGLGLVTVMTFDVARGLDAVDADAVVSDGRVVYASRSSLYVATDRYDARPGPGKSVRQGVTTAIHRFDISSPTQSRYRGTGSVPGTLLGQWSLSERDGVLRVASTSVPTWFGGAGTESETWVTALAVRANGLARLGGVGGLGKGERVYAVRFIGDTGYVVTFRQVDPLYVLDLAAPSRPAVRGELKILGYSAYLHPVGDGLLLGIGRDATAEGRVQGVQASLFDVSNAAAPRRLDAFALGNGWSEAEQDHHAFLWWPRTGLAVLPVQAYDDRPFVGALGLRVRRADGITEVGRVAHPDVSGASPVGSPGTPIRRSVVVGDALYTVSAAGVRGSRLGSFADLGFARLPQPAAPPPPTPSR